MSATLLKLVMQLDIEHFIVQFHILIYMAVVFGTCIDVEEPGDSIIKTYLAMTVFWKT